MITQYNVPIHNSVSEYKKRTFPALNNCIIFKFNIKDCFRSASCKSVKRKCSTVWLIIPTELHILKIYKTPSSAGLRGKP